MTSQTTLAWYFSAEDRRLRYGDGREIKAGVTHEFDGTPALCQRGLHASINPLHALDYAPGPVIWRVRLSGMIVRGDDKLVATRRTYLWGYDATEVLHAFARKCALDVIDKWDAPAVVREYLETGDESKRAAVREAAWEAARDAAWEAARDAARAAVREAAWGAARAAAWEAARAAVRDAAWEAAREAQNKRLLQMIRKGRAK